MRTVIVSLISFLMAFLLFATAVYAWFTLSEQSNLNHVDLQVTEGPSYDYEIKYYTKDYVYKYDTVSGIITVYNTVTSTWVLPQDLNGYPEYSFDGVFISQYDALIPENNFKNNLIIEINIDFTNTSSMVLEQRMISNPALSSSLVSSMTLDTARAYYVSEVAHVQTLLSSSYNHLSDTFNKYEALTTEFNLKDGSNNLVYPKYGFYQNNVYNSILSLGSNSIEPNSTLRYFYNISYDDLRVNQFFTSEFQNSNYSLSNIPTILFFQDISIQFSGGTN